MGFRDGSPLALDSGRSRLASSGRGNSSLGGGFTPVMGD